MAGDPYQELGVSRSASADEVRKAFRKLAKDLHPDRNPGDKAAEERFKRVSAAFDILGDPDKRGRFDRGEIDADGREVPRGYSGGPWGQAGGQRGGFEGGASFDDILSEVFGGRGGPRGFGGNGGFGGGRGADMRAKLEIDLEEAIKGGVKRIGFADGRTLDVTIPKGASEGQVLRLKGQGQPGRTGPGDVLVELIVKPHPVYRREGEDLHMDLYVTVPDAVLGAKVDAPTPDGAVSLTVPKGSSSGSTLRLKGRGAVAASGKRGDLFARIVVALPDQTDSELEAFAERWRKERPYSPRRRG